MFALFTGALGPEAFLEGIVELLGRRYSLVAYMLYVLDDQNFMPIAPQTFDVAFSKLELSLRVSGRCSWENYTDFNATIRQVQVALTEWGGVSGVRLIDAHSFLWMMVRVTQQLEQQVKQGLRRPDALKWAMVDQVQAILHRVKNSNGQTEERTVKNKDLIGFSTHEAFYEFLCELWRKQGGLCRLTDLPMVLTKSPDVSNDHVMSVDRIDSDGPYSPENIQLTCWFANRWKGSQNDFEFRKLLEDVRLVGAAGSLD